MRNERLSPDRARAFILANTDVLAPPHVPEIRLHLAGEAHGLWLKTEEELSEIGLPPPFWAFAWAGGQALSRFVLDRPGHVAGRHVVDFASGSGLVAIAAAKAGAASVKAVDIDPFCRESILLNAALNAVSLDIAIEDIVGQAVATDIVLAGDVFFDKAMAAPLVPWFDRLAAEGVEILIGDPGRTYLPAARMTALATYEVPVTRVLEDAEVKRTTVWRWEA
ncbi:MAG: methyltransferase [Rhizobiaceae bacterium]|nr:methyltransferase [Rhizobiaceae bacterium]